MTKKMNKSQRIAAFVNEKPEVMPKIFNTAQGTSIWRSEKDYVMMDVSVSYAYQIAKREHGKFLRAKHVAEHVSVTTEPPKPDRPKRTAWQKLVRKLTVRCRRLVRKFMRLTGLYAEIK